MPRNTLGAMLLAGLMLLPAAIRAETIPQQIQNLQGASAVAGNDWSVLIENENGSLVYYEQNPDMPLAPASNMKMFTTAAAFDLLGTDYTFETRIYTGGTIDEDGVLQGHLHLLSEHDITWNTSTLGSGGTGSRKALDRIAQQLKSKGLNEVAASVNVWGATFYDRGQFDNVRTTARSTLNQATADAFRDALTAAGITVHGSAIGRSGWNPPGDLFHTHQSDELNYVWGGPLRLENACIPLNRISHNPMAEALLFHIGWKLGDADSLSAGAEVLYEWLEDVVEIPNPGDLDFRDGSGLSWSNRVSARQTLMLSRWMLENYPSWGVTMPISGQSGTISRRLNTPSNLIGRVRAKTGTLSISIALSGWIDNPFDDERYFFAILTNRSNIDRTGSRVVVDNIVRTIGVRGVPLSPDLLHVKGLPDGQGIEVAWRTYPWAKDGYIVEVSSDGQSYTQVAEVPAPETMEYIIETRSDLQDVQNPDDFSYEGDFTPSTSHSTAPGCTPGAGSMFIWTADDGHGVARFTPSGLPTGRYDVFVTSFNFASANAENVTVRLHGADGEQEFFFDLVQAVTGNRWGHVGTMDIVEGEGHHVEFDNETQTTLGSDDRMNPAAVRFLSAEDAPAVYTDTDAAPGESRYYRVAPTGPHGEGKPSRVYGARPGGDGPVLIVDGNNRWIRQPVPENDDVENHDFVTRIGASIPERFAFDSAHNEAVEAGLFSLSAYPATVWSVGEESTADVTFSAAERSIVTDYLQNGGALFATGSELGWDLDHHGTAPSRQFFREVLKQRYIADSAETFQSRGLDGQLYEGLDDLDFSGPPMIINWPDVVEPVHGSEAAIEYVGGIGGVGGVLYNGEYRLSSFGYPFESLNTAATRAEVMHRTLSFFLPPGRVANVRIEEEGGAHLLRWDEPNHHGITGYRVYTAQDAGGPWEPVEGPLAAEAEYELTGESAWFSVAAVDDWEDEGERSEAVLYDLVTLPFDGLVLF